MPIARIKLTTASDEGDHVIVWARTKPAPVLTIAVVVLALIVIVLGVLLRNDDSTDSVLLADAEKTLDDYINATPPQIGLRSRPEPPWVG